MTPAEAIKKHCQQCQVVNNFDPIINCFDMDCPVFKFRPGVKETATKTERVKAINNFCFHCCGAETTEKGINELQKKKIYPDAVKCKEKTCSLYGFFKEKK